LTDGPLPFLALEPEQPRDHTFAVLSEIWCASPAANGGDDEKACVIAEPAIDTETPDAAEAAHFLRRFADLMSNGHNAKYLLRAAELLETLSARASAATDEEKLWRYKYETLAQHTDRLEAECGRLKDDIEGHVNVADFILAERDSLKAALEKREAELLELSQEYQRELDQSATVSETHQSALTELRVAFDQDRLALMAAADVSAKELDQQRQMFERERAEHAAEWKRREDEAAELRLAFDREREELQTRLRSSEEALVASRAVSEREFAGLREQIEALEVKRAELRLSLERIGQLRAEPERHDVELAPTRAGEANSPVDETSAVVSKETLRQARAQFEFLAKECLRRGDVATQAMCELGAHAMQLALAGDESADASPTGRMALTILSLSDPSSSVRGQPGQSAG
jgi:chromosome segregation ATPase